MMPGTQRNLSKLNESPTDKSANLGRARNLSHTPLYKAASTRSMDMRRNSTVVQKGKDVQTLIHKDSSGYPSSFAAKRNSQMLPNLAAKRFSNVTRPQTQIHATQHASQTSTNIDSLEEKQARLAKLDH